MKAIQHIAMKCTDVKAQEAFYTKYLGFRRTRTYSPGTPGEFFMLRLGDTYIEMFPAAPEDVSRRASEPPVGFQHMAFDVPDLDAALAVLHADGIVTEPIMDCDQHIKGMRVCFFHDPDGNRIEFSQGYVDEPDV